MNGSVQRHRRAIGAGLTAYGLAGLVAGILIVGATLAVGTGLEPALERVDRQRDAIVASLEHSVSALDQVATIADDATGSVEQAAAIASQSADVSRRFAETLSRLASTFGSFGILGNRPFAPLAEDATQVAAQLRGIATDLDALGISMSRVAREIPPLTAEVRALSAELDTLATELAAFEVPAAAGSAFRWLIVGIMILVSWLLVPAVVSLVAGILLLRGPREPSSP
jgi:ABC-type transporter Mla subunit MlaD